MPLNSIVSSTNISGTGDVWPGFYTSELTTLADGSFALVYMDHNRGIEVVWTIFTSEGAPIFTGGTPVNIANRDEDPDIVALSGSGFALTWIATRDDHVFSAVYDEDGVTLVAPFNVSDAPSSSWPQIAALDNDVYAVTWFQVTTVTVEGSPVSNYEIYTAVYNAQGTEIQGPVLVSVADGVSDQVPKIAALSNGNYALSWTKNPDNGLPEIYTAVYSALGTPVAAAALVGLGANVQIAALEDGGYALTAVSSGVMTAVYDNSGAQVAAPVAVASGQDSRIAALENGNYALFWTDGTDAWTAVYNGQGQQISTPVNVTVANPFGDSASDILALSNGAYALTWEGETEPGSVGNAVPADIFIAVFDAQGQQAIAPVNVSSTPGLHDTAATLTALAAGAFTVAWQGDVTGALYGDQFMAIYQFVAPPPPPNVILPPTNISNSGVAFGPQIATLSNGNYALTYSDGADTVWKVFEPQGQPVVSGSIDILVDIFSDIAALSGGGFALAWEEGVDVSVYTAVYDAVGNELVAPILAGTNATIPVVTALADDTYVIAWQQQTTSGNFDNIITIRDAAGNVVLAPTDITGTPTVNDDAAVVTVLSNGNFALTWSSYALDGKPDYFTSVYTAQGVQITAPYNVSNTAGVSEASLRAAALTSGDYALTWLTEAPGGALQVMTAVHDELGQQIVAPVTVGLAVDARIAALGDGNYALFWSNGTDVFTAVFDDQGQVVSAPVNVSNGLGIDIPSDITVLSNGAYALTWESNFGSVGNVDLELFTAVFTAQGQQAAGLINVTNSPGVSESFAVVTALADGAYALSWEGGTAGGTDIFMAIYQFEPPPPAATFNVIQAATNISNTGLVFPGVVAITTLSDGGFALTYHDVFGAIWGAYGPEGQSLSVGDFDDASFSDVAALSGGGFALAFDETFMIAEIFAAIYDDQGGVVVAPFNVSQTPLPGGTHEVFPTVTGLASGDFVLTWQAPVHVSGVFVGWDIHFSVYDGATGSAVFAPINISDTPTGRVGDENDQDVDVAVLSNGNIAFVWGSDSLMAVYEPDGDLVLGLTDATGPNSIGTARVAALAEGGYALTWMEGGTTNVRTSIFNNDGQEVVAPVTVFGSGLVSEIEGLSDGNYAMSWGGSDSYLAIYDAQGVEVAAPINLSNTAGEDGAARIVELSNGAIALAWMGQLADLSYAVFTAVYSADGLELVAPVNVGAADTGNLAATALDDGAYAITWMGPSAFGADQFTAIYQFVAPPPADVSYDNVPDVTLDLSSLVDLGASLTITDNGALVSIDLSNLISIGGNFTLSNNGVLLTVTVPNLIGVSGDLEISDNALADAINLAALVTVSGNLDVSGNAAAGNLDLGSLGTVAGDLIVSDNTSATTINLANLATVSGDLDIGGNAAAGDLDLGSLTEGGGSVVIQDNTAAGNLDLGSLGTVAGDLIVSDNTSATTINLANLAAVSGDLDISGNTAAGNLDLGSLGTVSGILDITGNTSAITIDLGALIAAGAIVIANNGVLTLDLSALVSAGGDVSVTGNGSLLAIDMPNLTEVSGEVAVTGNAASSILFAALNTVGGGVTVSASDGTSNTIAFGELDTVGDGTSNTIIFGELDTVGGGVSVTVNDGTSNTILFGELDTVGGGVSITVNDGSSNTIVLGELDTVEGDVIIEAGGDATSVDASDLGPGGGDVVMGGGSNGDSTITVGSLENMAGSLSITGAGGVTITAESGIAHLTITGTDGDDDVTGSATAGNTMEGGGGNDDLTGGAAADDIDGGEGNDTLEAGDGDDTVSGGAGDDTVVGGHGRGDDIYDGGADNDTVTFTSTTLGVIVDLAAGTASSAETGSDTLIAIENVTGGSGGDEIRGDGVANVLAGRDGDDLLEGRGGDDRLEGGEGSDTAIYSGKRRDYTVEATAVPNQYRITDNRAGANDGSDLVTDFESFRFSDIALAVADILNTAPLADADGPYTGDEDTLLIVGAAGGVLGGDSDLEGDALTAVLVSGPSNELSFTLNADGSFSYQGEVNFNGPDAFTYRAFDGEAYSDAITVQLNVAPVNDAPTLTNAILDQSATTDVTFAFAVPVATFADVDLEDQLALSATLSNGDPLPGWLTFDPATGAFSGTPISADIGAITVRVTATDGSLASVFDDFVLTVEGILNVINGTSGNDRNLSGTGQADLINGFAGNDRIDTKEGNDRIIAGAGNDQVYAGAGDDVVVATIGDGNDIYHGEAGIDTFDLSQTMAPANVRLGPTVSGANSNDTGRATSAEIGNDALFSFENVIGSSGSDTIIGNDAANILSGGAGDDTVRGLAGDDVLTGGRGSDWMAGGLGRDTFAFLATQSQAGDVDTVADFTVGQDHLFFEGVTITSITEIDVDGDTTVDTSLTLSDGSAIHVLGVSGVGNGAILLLLL